MPVLTLATLFAAGMSGCTAPPAADAPPAATPRAGAPAGCDPNVVALVEGAQFYSLQDAWDASGDNATIAVCPGEWHERVQTRFEQVVGRRVVSASGNSSDTILIADETQSSIALFDSPFIQVSFQDLTFLGGTPSIDLAIYPWTQIPSTYLRVNDCVFESYYTDASSAINADLESINIENSNFTFHSGGIDIGFTTDLNIINNEFYGNFKLASPFDYFQLSDSSRAVFSDNFVDGPSIDFSFRDATHSLIVENNTFTRHMADPFSVDPNGAAALRVYVSAGAQVDLDIVDTTFDSNFGYDASHVQLDRDPFEDRSLSHIDATFTRTNFWRGGWGAGDIPDDTRTPGEAHVVGAAIGIGTSSRSYDLTFEDVDFGTGPTANYGRTLDVCAEHKEGLFSGTHSYPTPRPTCPW
jgi:hypothetical protein